MKFIDANKANDHWDIVVIGSGFGSIFFLKEYLEHKPEARVLILEWGQFNSAAWQLEHGLNSDIDRNATFTNQGEKPWDFTIGVGGSSNCWWALTPRLHPSDFRIFTDHGVGADWPISYDELIPYYQKAEAIMLVAGPDDLDPFYPGTGKYPLPAHRLTTAEDMIRSSGDPYHFAIPNARASVATEKRGQCCAHGQCNLCPSGAKFTIIRDMEDVFQYPNVAVCPGSRALTIDTTAGIAQAVRFKNGAKEFLAKGDLIVLGANAIQSPFILLRSGIGGHGVGRYLGEKQLAKVEVYLDGLDHFDGGTASTGFNIGLVENNNRAEYGAALVLVDNILSFPGFRPEKDRWRQVLPLSIYIEDVFDYENGVYDEGGDRPVVKFKGFSEYAQKGLNAAMDYLPKMLAPLPVERINFQQIWPTMGHMQGSLRMGLSKDNSVIDRDLLHHDIRNLVVVGTSTFPTTGSANPTLTAAALSLRAAERLVAS